MWRGKTVVKMKNDFTGLISRLNISKESVNLTIAIWNWNRMEKIFDHPRTISSILTYINWNPNKKRENKQKRALEERMTNSFIRTMENIKLQIQEFQRTSSKIKRKNSCTHHIQATKNQRKCLRKPGKKRYITYRRRKINTSTSITNPQSSWQWSDIFKGKRNQPRILYLAKMLFKNEGKINTFFFSR